MHSRRLKLRLNMTAPDITGHGASCQCASFPPSAPRHTVDHAQSCSCRQFENAANAAYSTIRSVSQQRSVAATLLSALSASATASTADHQCSHQHAQAYNKHTGYHQTGCWMHKKVGLTCLKTTHHAANTAHSTYKTDTARRGPAPCLERWWPKADLNAGCAALHTDKFGPIWERQQPRRAQQAGAGPLHMKNCMQDNKDPKASPTPDAARKHSATTIKNHIPNKTNWLQLHVKQLKEWTGPTKAG